jgi:hypothetical protein
MRLSEIYMTLNESEIQFLNESSFLNEINKIINAGFKKSVENLSRGIHDYAATCLHKVPKGSQEYKILDKIVANPVQITKQLIRSVMDKDKSSDKNASNKDPEKDKVPSLGNIDDILADLTF